MTVTATPPAVQSHSVVNPDATKAINDISAIVQTFSAGMTQRVSVLEQEVAQHKRDAAVRQQQADESAVRIEQLENALKDQEQVVLACRQEAADLLSKNKEAEAAAADHAQEKKRLVDTIAEQREQLSTKQLEVGDLKKENESLRAEIDAVYAKIAGLLPDVKRPSSFTKAMEKVAKGVGEFTETVEAVCVAAKEEVTEAVQSTNNYAKAPPAIEMSAPKQGGGAAAAAASAAAAAAPVPSTFVQMMDREMDEAMTDLETELVSETDRDAFRKLSNMGFDVDQARVCELMAQHSGDVSVILEALLQ
jgi:small-conductance mechanosensitive channel